MTINIKRGDARHIDLADGSVDLIVTSPPYWAQRSYTDNNGEHYAGQIGDEETPGEYLDNLIDCMREWARVLKDDGNLWVNLGDKYVSNETNRGNGSIQGNHPRPVVSKGGLTGGDMARQKSLIGLPWRFALRCIDELGLILRAEVVWSKKNGLPESVVDRVRRSHEQWFHFTKSPKHFAAIDYVRQLHASGTAKRYAAGYGDRSHMNNARQSVGYDLGGDWQLNALGALPNSVWHIATEPLRVPERVAHAKCCGGVKKAGCEGLDHYAAFPLEFPIRIIRGWSPSGICTKCGEGRRPATMDERVVLKDRAGEKNGHVPGQSPNGGYRGSVSRTIVGEICACTPYTQHAASGEPHANPKVGLNTALQSGQRSGKPHTGPWREYHCDRWDPAPTTPTVVLDPFGGTGTVALVADVLGRHGEYRDGSGDYCDLARWRTADPDERARALRVAKPPKQLDDQVSLWDIIFEDLEDDAASELSA